MIPAPTTACTARRHYSKREIRAQYPCSDATLNRKTRPRSAKNPWGGQLPQPCGCIGPGGCNLFDADAVDRALLVLRSQPKRAFPRGVEADGRERGHVLRDEFAELKAVAAEGLAVGGMEEVARVLARYTSTGKLTDVPVSSRRAAIAMLTRLVVQR